MKKHIRLAVVYVILGLIVYFYFGFGFTSTRTLPGGLVVEKKYSGFILDVLLLPSKDANGERPKDVVVNFVTYAQSGETDKAKKLWDPKKDPVSSPDAPTFDAYSRKFAKWSGSRIRWSS